MIKRLLTFLLSVITIFSYGQEGNAFIQNYSPKIEEADGKNFAITQGGNGVMYFANSRGIITYDGVRWGFVDTPGTPFSLTTDTESGKVYVGCKGDFGYLEIEKTGEEVYESISDDGDEFGEITNIFTTDGNVFFYSTRVVYQYEIEDDDDVNSWEVQEGDVFTGLIKHKNNLYVNTAKLGLQKLTEDGLKPLTNGNQFTDIEIIISVSLGNGKTLICTNDNKCYTFDGKNFSPFKIEAIDYLKESDIVSGISLTKDIISLGTVNGGCVLIDIKTGKTENIINYQTGLPDDEVYAISRDKTGGLWIAHEYGISRVDFELPVTNLSTYNGLRGNLISCAESNGKVYVSTTIGVFQLTKLSASEVARFTKQGGGKGGKVGKFFSKIFKSKKKRRAQEDAAQVSFYALQSVRYGYKPVKGIDDKCRELLPYKGKVLAATNSGLYSINGQYASAIIKGSYIHFIYQSRQNPNQFYVGTDKGLRTVNYNGSWKVDDEVKGINRPIYSITEDGENHLWLGGENEVIRVSLLENGKIGDHKSYLLESNFSEHINVRSIKSAPMFFSHLGVYNYNKDDDELYLNEELSERFTKSSMVFSHDGYTWLYNGIRWKGYIESAKGNDIEVDYLNVVDNILNIFIDKNNNCWIVDNNNGFYKVKANVKRKNDEHFYLTTREVKGGDENLLNLGDVTLTYDNSAVRFTFTSPFYLNEEGTQYQYFLDGVMDDWSGWEDNAIVDFPYLPEGSYELHVKAKNVFGEIAVGKVIEIDVIPPFYRRWWFYLLEIIFISGLLFGSIMLNANEESTALSKTLTFLTFIIIYKMLATIIKYTFGSSFVFDLIVSVALAVLVHKAEDKLIEYGKSESAKRMKKQIAVWWNGSVIKEYALNMRNRIKK